jgi:acyl-CoA reductase-like NAD-dependent aldehyde dehydrogenase
MPPTPPEEVDRVIASLAAAAQKWVDTDCKTRGELLRQTIQTTLDITEEAATAGTEHKGSYGNGIGDELYVPVLCWSTMFLMHAAYTRPYR